MLRLRLLVLEGGENPFTSEAVLQVLQVNRNLAAWRGGRKEAWKAEDGGEGREGRRERGNRGGPGAEKGQKRR